MEIIRTVQEMRQWIENKKKNGQEIGLVPTMGFLHEGHLSLADRAKEENDAVVMSIFVNPTQFGPQEDFAAYPRDFKRDCKLAEERGVDAVFSPPVEEMYPTYPPLTKVQVRQISEGLCGASRPGHFEGVATVVSKLFNIVQPHKAYFGQKDYQQVQVIKKFVEDLNYSIKIRTVPIKREPDGLAMSSRNTYLSPEERKEALCLFEALQSCKELFERGETSASILQETMKKRICAEKDAEIDYIKICNAETLSEVDEIKDATVVALAVKIGRTRLIDNLVLGGEKVD